MTIILPITVPHGDEAYESAGKHSKMPIGVASTERPDELAISRHDDEVCRILALGARFWPRWLWLVGTFFVQPEAHIAAEWHKLRWYKETPVPVAVEGAEIGVTYTAASWGLVPEARIFARPGDRVVYRARAFWRKGLLTPA